MDWKQIIPAVILAVFAVTLGIMLTGYFTAQQIPSCTVYCNDSACVSTEAAIENNVVCLSGDIVGSIEITADNVTLNCQNFAIDGNQSAAGVFVAGYNKSTIVNCEISNASAMIRILNSFGHRISNNTLHSSRAYLYGTGQEVEHGVLLQNVDNTSISFNEIYDIKGVKNARGINVDDGENIQILNNTVYDIIYSSVPNQGIYLNGNNSVISGNVVYNIQGTSTGTLISGIYFSGDNATISFNKVSNSSHGISIYETNDVILEENEIYDCSEGILGGGIVLDTTNDTIIVDTKLHGNNYGLTLVYQSFGTELYNSNISNNNFYGILIYDGVSEIDWIIDDEANLLNNPAQLTNIIIEQGLLEIENSDIEIHNTTIGNTGSLRFSNAQYTSLDFMNVTGNFFLTNSTLKINSSYPGSYDVMIVSDGTVTILDSLITAVNPLEPFHFSVPSSTLVNITINNSQIEYYNSFSISTDGLAMIYNNTFVNGQALSISYTSNFYVLDNYFDLPGSGRSINIGTGTYGGTVSGNTILNSDVGIDLGQSASSVNVVYNTIQNTQTGVYLERNCNFNNISHNTIEASTVGIYLKGVEKIPFGWFRPMNNTIFNNTFINVGGTSFDEAPILLFQAYYNTIRSNKGYGWVDATFIYLLNSNENNISHNEMSGYFAGMILDASLGNKISYNRLDSTEYGIILINSPGNNFSNDYIMNSGSSDFYAYASDNSIITNLTTGISGIPDVHNTTSSFIFEGEISLIYSDGSGLPTMSGYTNTSHFLNITGTDWMFLNISYEDSDVPSGESEYTLKLLKHNGTEWIRPGTWATPNTVNVRDKYVYANITDFGSIFAPMTAIVCECTNETDCEDKLNDTSLCPGGISLTEDIVSEDGLTLENIASTLIDCNNFAWIGDGTQPFFEGSINNSILRNCIIRNYTHGLILTNSQYNQILNNVFEDIDYGIQLVASSDNTMTSNRINSNNWAFSSESDSIRNELNEIDIGTTKLSMQSKDITLEKAQPITGIPDSYSAINHFVEITGNSMDSWMNLTIFYSAQDIAIQNFAESTLKMWKHDVAWTELPDSGVNLADKFVYSGNVTSLSVFAPLGEIRAPHAPSTGAGATPTRQEFTCAGKVANYYFNILNAFETKIIEDGFCNDLRIAAIQTNTEVLGTEIRIKETDFDNDAPNEIYKYFEIYSTQVSKYNLEQALLELRISREWVSKNNIDASTIELYKYDNGWMPLDAEQTISDASYYYFTAETEEFSIFAASGESVIEDDFWYVFEVIQKYYMDEVSFEEVVDVINLFYKNRQVVQ